MTVSQQELERVLAHVRDLQERVAELEQREQADVPTSGVPSAVAQGDIIAADSDPKWTVLTVGGAHFLLKVNPAGTDPAWVAFDWDALQAAAGSDMVHSHQSNAEGGQLAVAALTDHNKAVHDALNIDADTLDSLNSTAFWLVATDQTSLSGRKQLADAANGEEYNTAPLEIMQTYSAGAGNAPRISFYYGGAIATQFGYVAGDATGDLAVIKNPVSAGYDSLRLDVLKIYSGTTQYGEIYVDASWMRLNQSIAVNVYTPRMFRADNGIASGGATPAAGEIRSTDDIAAGRGLYVGNPAGVPDDNDVHIDGSINVSTALGCRARRSTLQAITTGTWTAVSFDVQEYDTDGGFAPTSTLLYAKHAGYYMAGGCVLWDEPNPTAGSYRIIAIEKNGTTYLAMQHQYPANNIDIHLSVSTGMFYMAVNDYIRVLVFQDRGGNTNIIPSNSFTPNGWLARIP